MARTRPTPTPMCPQHPHVYLVKEPDGWWCTKGNHYPKNVRKD